MTRKQLEAYMTDCHGFDKDQLSEWDTKSDLWADIKSFGWEQECKDYIGV